MNRKGLYRNIYLPTFNFAEIGEKNPNGSALYFSEIFYTIKPESTFEEILANVKINFAHPIYEGEWQSGCIQLDLVKNLYKNIKIGDIKFLFKKGEIQLESTEIMVSNHLKMLLDAQQKFNENSAARSAVGQNVTKLSEQIAHIENAIKSIQNISMQVKIVSLNASVEAARVGAAGKGFSVVVEEIRRLSQNTEIAASQIGNAVDMLCTLINNTTNDMGNAQKIGAVFAKSLDACVENAHNLNKHVNEEK